MQDNYEHYITRNIKSLYRRRLIAPTIYLIFTTFLWVFLPVFSILFPTKMEDLKAMGDMYDRKEYYVETELKNLNFTGYTKTRYGRTAGYFYYCKDKDRGYVVLLNPSTCEQGLPEIKKLTLRGKIMEKDKNYDALLDKLSLDLHWTKTGISSKVDSFYLSEPDFRALFGWILFVLMGASTLFSLIALLLNILFIAVPELSPPCQTLGNFGKRRELFAQAEEELATLPQLATEDMFITEHFFIETSVYGNAIVPINEIIWIYKYSTLHKFFWYHFSISYTLHISANKHLYIQCPKNIKSDIDGIIDYLAEANHNILVGFSEENRLKVQNIQGTPMHFEKFIAFLNKRI